MSIVAYIVPIVASKSPKAQDAKGPKWRVLVETLVKMLVKTKACEEEKPWSRR